MRKRILSTVLSASMVMGLLTGCGTSATSETAKTEAEKTETTKATTTGETEGTVTEEKEPVKIVMQLGNFIADYPEIGVALEEIKQMDKYSHVEFELIESDAEYNTTMPIAVSGGEQRDIVSVTSPMNQQQWADAGVILPLDEYVEAAGVDLDVEFGQYKENGIKNGQFYVVPNKVNQWSLYYNKQIFDDAGIEYPDSKVPMTWDEYKDLAAQLTSGSGSEKIYGSMQINWSNYWYGPAIMALGGGEQFYNAEGLSNIEDPAFAKALQLCYDMRNVDKSAPSYADVATTKMGVNAFLNGNYAMTYQAAWMWPWLLDKETYPRDWKVGIAPMPVDEGTDLKTWGSVNGFCVGATSKNPQLAFEINMDLSRLSSKYAKSSVGGNQTEEQNELYQEVAAGLAEDDITLDDILYVTQNPDILYLTEKIMGTNNTAYEKVINEEVELFFVDEQSLEDTIKNIKERGDEAILK